MKLYPPPFHLCPIYDYVNKWDFFYPPPSQIGQCLILGNFFFLKASLSDPFGPISAKNHSDDACDFKVIGANRVLNIFRHFDNVPVNFFNFLLQILNKQSFWSN